MTSLKDLNFLEFLRINANNIAEILYCSVLSTPKRFNDREYRMLTDQIPRRQLYIQLPDTFQQLENSTGDITYIPTNETVSMKKGNNIFPKPKKRGNGFTKPLIQLINTLGDGLQKIFNAHYLLAYEPSDDGIFTLACLDQPTIENLMFKKGDQWIIKPSIQDWKFFSTFKFKHIKIDNNSLFSNMINKFYDEAYSATRKIYDI